MQRSAHGYISLRRREPGLLLLQPHQCGAAFRPDESRRSSAPPPLSFAILQNHFRFTVVFLLSVNFLHLPDDLLLEEGQDGVVLAHLLEHHPAVELVAHLLEIIPETGTEERVSRLASPRIRVAAAAADHL